MLYSLGLYPLINRPTRITTTPAPLIDNIFTSELENKINSGLLVHAISDHLQVFALRHCTAKHNISECSKKCIRHLSNENISALTYDLMEHSWRTVVGNENANTAYDNFIDDFAKMYNKHCPVSTVQPKVSQTSLHKTWFTKGLKMHLSRKITCIKHFYHPYQLSQKPDINLIKNKLTSILISSKKQYYSGLLAKKKNDMAGTWKVLKTIMGTPRFGRNYPDHFVNNNVTISIKKDIADMFYNYFTNSSPELSKDITVPTNASIYDYLGNRYNQNLFLTPVSEEVIRTGNTWECKTSKDCNNISMFWLKKLLIT